MRRRPDGSSRIGTTLIASGTLKSSIGGEPAANRRTHHCEKARAPGACGRDRVSRRPNEIGAPRRARISKPSRVPESQRGLGVVWRQVAGVRCPAGAVLADLGRFQRVRLHVSFAGPGTPFGLEPERIRFEQGRAGPPAGCRPVPDSVHHILLFQLTRKSVGSDRTRSGGLSRKRSLEVVLDESAGCRHAVSLTRTPRVSDNSLE
jgi:hypothetical protein